MVKQRRHAMCSGGALHAFQQRGTGGEILRRLGADTRGAREGSRAPLRCSGCGHPVTSDAERIAVNGAHEHHCINPAAIAYRIGCFGGAPGVVEAGQAISRHSWFAGFAWRLALCGQCGAHLGWAFTAAGATRFYGLILKRLAAGQ